MNAENVETEASPRCFILRVNPEDCPGGEGKPLVPEAWNGKPFKCGRPRAPKEGGPSPSAGAYDPLPGDNVLIWVNEERGGSGLTAEALVETYTPGKIVVRNAKILPNPKLGKTFYKANLHRQVFRDLKEDCISKLRFTNSEGKLLLLAAAEAFNALFVPQLNMVADFDARISAIEEGGLSAVTRLVEQRVGQEVFRDGLMALWQGRCAISGLAVTELLRASHAKAWARCETRGERLNPFNGLLLAAHLDAAFDSGFIAVDDDGSLLVAGDLDDSALIVLGLRRGARVRALHKEHLPWMREHRTHWDSTRRYRKL